MKILFIAPYVPTLVRTRPFNFVRELAERGNNVTLYAVWSNEAERAELDLVKSFCHSVKTVHVPTLRSLVNCATAVPTRAPFQSVYSWHKGLVSHLNGDTPYDVVHVEHLRGARFGLYIKQNTNLPVVWDSVDCISHLFEQAAAKSESKLGRLRSLAELKRTKRYESWLLDKFDHTLVTSRQDKEALLALNGSRRHAPISVLHNGVDFSHFQKGCTAERQQDTLVVSGKMSYHANVSMVLYLLKEIMPLVWRKRPQTKLSIVGKDPAPEITAWAEHPNVTVTGTVPEIRPYLQQSAVALTPITYGAGIQNKVLEAMACATPVVTTPKAVSAISVRSGRELMIAETPEAFAAAVCTLLDSPKLRQQIGEAGYRYVEQNHHWNQIAARLEGIYRQAVEPNNVAQTNSGTTPHPKREDILRNA